MYLSEKAHEEHCRDLCRERAQSRLLRQLLQQRHRQSKNKPAARPLANLLLMPGLPLKQLKEAETDHMGDVEKSDSAGKSMQTSIWYEILLVTLETDHIVTIAPSQDGKAHPWLVPHQAGIHPNDAVFAQVQRVFGEHFEPEASIIHSTSWRFCPRANRVLLTYLVVLPQRTWQRWQATHTHLVARQVGQQIQQVQGDHLQAPKIIAGDHVLAHALDHLALLQHTNQSIQAVLETGWVRVLQARQLKPAGYVGEAQCTGRGKQATATPEHRQQRTTS